MTIGLAPAAPLSQQPGLTLPDQVIIALLQGEAERIRRDPGLIRQALASYGQAFVGQMMHVLGRRAIPVYEGWPVNAEMVPGIGVTLRPAVEDILGLAGPLGVTSEGTELYGRQMQASVVIVCYAANQREANALAYVVSFLLLVHQRHLEVVEGLYNTSIQITDLRPEEDAPLKLQFLYMRSVSLTCTYLDTYALTYPIAGASQGGADDQ